MRYRFEGNRMRVLDAQPFRRADPSPREELSEAQAELAKLEEWRRANTHWQSWPASDEPQMKRIEELKRKVRGLELFFDSAWKPGPGITSVADLNQRNAAYYRERER
jgi:hypothetical protein